MIYEVVKRALLPYDDEDDVLARFDSEQQARAFVADQDWYGNHPNDYYINEYSVEYTLVGRI